MEPLEFAPFAAVVALACALTILHKLIASTSVTRELKGKNVSLYDYKSCLQRCIVRFCASSRSIPLPLKSLNFSYRALYQVLQRALSLLIGCRFLDALLPIAVVFDGEIPPPVSDLNLCQIGVLMFPTSQLGHIALPRQLAVACLANVLR